MRVLLLPSIPYGPLRDAHARGECPMPSVSEALRAHGVETTEIAPGAWPRNPLVRMHPFYRAFDPWRLLRAALTGARYDLVVSGNDSAAVALAEWRRWFGARFKLAIWDFSPATRWRARRIAQDRALPLVDGVLALNRAQARYVPDRWGARARVEVVGHWVDTDFYRPAAGLGAGVLAVGDDGGRDYPTLVEALRGSGIAATIRSDRGVSAADAARAGATLLERRVSASAFRDLYSAHRVVAVPLRADTANASGVSAILEAAAMGRPVVASDSAGVREYLRDGETALVVPADDPAAMRAAIRRVLDDDALARRLGESGRRMVEADYAPSVFAARLAAGYRAIVDR